jgi:hypothetical protein
VDITPGPELNARRTVAQTALAEYTAERRQNDHPADWLSLAVKLANALSGLVAALDGAERGGADG